MRLAAAQSRRSFVVAVLEQALDDCDEAEAKYGVDLADEHAELEALSAAVEAAA